MSRLNTFVAKAEEGKQLGYTITERLLNCMVYPEQSSVVSSFRLWRFTIVPKTGIAALADIVLLFNGKCWEQL